MRRQSLRTRQTKVARIFRGKCGRGENFKERDLYLSVERIPGVFGWVIICSCIWANYLKSQEELWKGVGGIGLGIAGILLLAIVVRLPNVKGLHPKKKKKEWKEKEKTSIIWTWISFSDKILLLSLMPHFIHQIWFFITLGFQKIKFTLKD